MKLHYTQIQKLVDQASKEKDLSYQYKQARITQWKANENELNGRKRLTTETRDNESFGLAHKMVHTFMAKIAQPISFEYERGELGDSKKVELFNALKDKYKKIGKWNFMDRLGKYNAIVYGNAIFEAYGEQDDKKEFVFVNRLVDPNDFFIDPYMSIENKESARFMGVWNLKFSKAQLKAKMEDPNYIKATIKQIIEGLGDGDSETQQDVDKQNRQQSLGVYKNMAGQQDVYKFYRWITTGEDGERYYLVFDEYKRCIRADKWVNLQKSGLFPFYYWAAFPEPYEFWSRGPLEVSRLALQAQEKSINQLLDNAEMINDPQKLVNVDYIRNISQIKYKRRSYIEVTGNVSVNNAVQMLETPRLETPTETYSMLGSIVNAVSGVTDEVAGVSNTDGTLGISEQNLNQANDRFALMQDSYEQAYYDLAVLFREAVKQHMTRATSIKVLGSRGYIFKTITPEQIKMHDNDFDVMVSAKSQEEELDNQKSKQKLDFINSYLTLGVINPKRAFEEGAKIVGFEDDEIKSLLDTQNYINNEARAYAEMNLQLILKGKEPVPFYEADENYIREFKDLFTTMPDLINANKGASAKIMEHIDATLMTIAENQDHAMEQAIPEQNPAEAVAQAQMEGQASQQQQAMSEQQMMQGQAEMDKQNLQFEQGQQQAVQGSQLKMMEAEQQANLQAQLQAQQSATN